jgi:hypothetical protein
MDAWTAAAGLSDGPLFRRVRRRKYPEKIREALSERMIWHIVMKYARYGRFRRSAEGNGRSPQEVGSMRCGPTMVASLFYETEDNRIMVMDYTVDGVSFVPGQAVRLADKQIFYPGNSYMDIAPDGRRVAVLITPENEGQSKRNLPAQLLRRAAQKNAGEMTGENRGAGQLTARPSLGCSRPQALP